MWIVNIDDDFMQQEEVNIVDDFMSRLELEEVHMQGHMQGHEEDATDLAFLCGKFSMTELHFDDTVCYNGVAKWLYMTNAAVELCDPRFENEWLMQFFYN